MPTADLIRPESVTHVRGATTVLSGISLSLPSARLAVVPLHSSHIEPAR